MPAFRSRSTRGLSLHCLPPSAGGQAAPARGQSRTARPDRIPRDAAAPFAADGASRRHRAYGGWRRDKPSRPAPAIVREARKRRLWQGPPKALAEPNPASSIRMISTLGAPLGGRNCSIGANLVSGSLASEVINPVRFVAGRLRHHARLNQSGELRRLRGDKSSHRNAPPAPCD